MRTRSSAARSRSRRPPRPTPASRCSAARREARARLPVPLHERDQRRRARAELARPPGVHGRPGGRRDASPRRSASARRCSTRCKARAPRARARDRSRRRGRLRAGPRVDRGGDRGDPRGRGARGTPRAGRRSRSTRPRARCSATARTSFAGEGRTLDPAAMIEFYGDLADRFPLVSIEDGLDEDDWDDWRASRERLGDRVQLVGDDLFVTNVELPPARDRGRRRQRDPRQGEPDRDPDRDARRDRARARARATRRSSRTARARRRTRRSPTSPSRSNAGQIKTGAPFAHGSRREVQPAAAHRGSSSATMRCTPAGTRSAGDSLRR